VFGMDAEQARRVLWRPHLIETVVRAIGT